MVFRYYSLGSDINYVSSSLLESQNLWVRIVNTSFRPCIFCLSVCFPAASKHSIRPYLDAFQLTLGTGVKYDPYSFYLLVILRLNFVS